MIRDDDDQVDIDVPIPYVLTALGHREVVAFRAERDSSCVKHEWKYERSRGVAVCQNCGRAAQHSSESIPSYLGLKDRR